jgi:hypothetical protein
MRGPVVSRPIATLPSEGAFMTPFEMVHQRLRMSADQLRAKGIQLVTIDKTTEGMTIYMRKHGKPLLVHDEDTHLFPSDGFITKLLLLIN